MKAGTRNGVNTALKKPVLAKLNDAGIIAITAYLASRTPQERGRIPGLSTLGSG